MAQRVPTINKISFTAYFVQAAILLLIIFALFLFSVINYVVVGVAVYFLLSIYLKVLIPKWHRKGLYYVKKGALQEAILAFERSYEYFRINNWLDRYRAFVLLSTSQLSYQEMALVNIIYCYQQLGDQNMARKYIKKLREEFPDNKVV